MYCFCATHQETHSFHSWEQSHGLAAAWQNHLLGSSAGECVLKGGRGGGGEGGREGGEGGREGREGGGEGGRRGGRGVGRGGTGVQVNMDLQMATLKKHFSRQQLGTYSVSKCALKVCTITNTNTTYFYK